MTGRSQRHLREADWASYTDSAGEKNIPGVTAAPPTGPGLPATPPTGVTAGTPGAFVPNNATLPADLTALKNLGALGQTTAWAAGQSVVLGDGSHAHWNGHAWAAGAAHAVPPGQQGTGTP